MFILAAAMAMCATVMAQEKVAVDTALVKKRTEYVAEKYALDGQQSAKLLELNTKYADIVGRSFAPRGARRNFDRARRNPIEGGVRLPEQGNSVRSGRPMMPGGKRGGMSARRGEMREKMAAYDKELQSILTEEQYKSYKADMEKNAPRRVSGE